MRPHSVLVFSAEAKRGDAPCQGIPASGVVLREKRARGSGSAAVCPCGSWRALPLLSTARRCREFSLRSAGGRGLGRKCGMAERLPTRCFPSYACLAFSSLFFSSSVRRASSSSEVLSCASFCFLLSIHSNSHGVGLLAFPQGI